MTCATQDLVIQQGKTFLKILRWESSPFIYKGVTAITKAAPAVVTATGHGVPDGWRVAVVSVQGMKEINALSRPPRSTEFHKATLVDVNTVSLNAVNSSEFSAYTSGGFLQYYTPVDLAGYSGEMQIREAPQSTTVLLLLTVANGRVIIDNAAKTITLKILAVDTAAITFTTGVYEFEMLSPGGIVTQLLRGAITVEPEIVF